MESNRSAALTVPLIVTCYAAVIFSCMLTAMNSAALIDWSWYWLISPIWGLSFTCILFVGAVTWRVGMIRERENI